MSAGDAHRHVAEVVRLPDFEARRLDAPRPGTATTIEAETETGEVVTGYDFVLCIV